MGRANVPTPPVLWGIPAVVAKGLEQITRHWWLILLPIVLDLFLWLGPRLTVTELITENLALLPQQGTFEVYREQMLEMAPGINLWTALSFPVLGVPALMTGLSPEKTPVLTTSIDLSTVWLWFLAFAATNLLGILLGILNLNLIAQAVDPAPFLPRLARSSLQLIGLVIVAGISLFAIALLLIPVALFTAAIGWGATGAFLAGSLITFWVLIYLMFTPHYILLQGANLFSALQQSILFVRQRLTAVLWLSLLVFSAGTLLKSLWRLVDNGSWLTLISLFGHAFISTALLLATFLFFQHQQEEVKIANKNEKPEHPYPL